MREQCLMFMLLLAESEHAEKDPLEITFRKDIVESYKPIGKSLFTLFCLINICLSLSDNANKIKTLNIETA